MGIEQERKMTADECEELTDALAEDAAALPLGPKKQKVIEAVGRLSHSRPSEAFGIAQGELTNETQITGSVNTFFF